MLEKWDQAGYAPLKELRVVAGKSAWLGGVLPRARWTTSVFYAVLAQTLREEESTTSSSARNRRGLFAVKRLELARKWMIQFLAAAKLRSMRRIAIVTGDLATINITTDASPEALGGTLAVNGRIVAAFFSTMEKKQTDELLVDFMESSSQSVLETLAILVALRRWQEKLKGMSVTVTIQSDSVTALALAQRLSAKSSSPGLNFLGAELSLCLEELGIEELKTRHIPGKANVAPDFLSRPSSWRSVPLPEQLIGVDICPDNRPMSGGFYRLPTPLAAPTLWGVQGEAAGGVSAFLAQMGSNMTVGDSPAVNEDSVDLTTDGEDVGFDSKSPFGNTSFPPLPPGLATEAELRAGAAGNTWAQGWAKLRGWMSPKKRPLQAPEETGPEATKPRKELPVIKKSVENKDKLAKALAAAGQLKRRGLKAPSIEAGFSAASSKDSKNAKRKTVEKLLEALTGEHPTSLTVDVLKGLASALEQGGYKAGEGYMIEAKLWHIESGHRTAQESCRDPQRAEGATKQAERAVKFGKELFVFCVVWMLRELELANVDTEDITLDHTSRRVTLALKMTKMDQGAKGVKRTLQCLCTNNNCEPECPFIVSQNLVEKVEKFNGTGSPVALTKSKNLAKKADLVRTWKWLYGKDSSGHSGRRTGALQYIRSGWSVTQVAHLGRWKSSAILSYAEEALEQLPANLNVSSPVLDTKGGATLEKRWVDEKELEAWKTQLRKEIEELKGNVNAKNDEREKVLEKWVNFYRDNPGTLPRKILSLPGKVIHWNLAKSAASPPLTWRTACGWSYYGSNFTYADAEAEITYAKLVRADLSRAKLDSANLMGVDLRQSICNGASFQGAQMRSAKLDAAKLAETSLENSILSGSTLTHADLQGVQARNARLLEADLSFSTGRKAVFSGADLRKAKVIGCQLEEANFDDTNLVEASLRTSTMRWSSMLRARMGRADLTQAQLQRVNMTGADLFHATLDEADLQDACLRGCSLDDARLRCCRLKRCDLRGTQLPEQHGILQKDLEGVVHDLPLPKGRVDGLKSPGRAR
eukprot:s454_g7.t1